MPFNPWLGFVAETIVAMRRTFEVMARPPEPGQPDAGTPAAGLKQWATRHTVLAELPTMRVLDFSDGHGGPGAIIVAPYALHAATTADLARGHSVIGALLDAGVSRLVLTDWRRAGEAQRYLSIDSCLADLNAIVDDFGAPAALVGLCQGGLLAAVYAARFPAKISRLALVGAPIDIEAGSSLISTSVQHTLPFAIEAMLEQGNGILHGEQLMVAWPSQILDEPGICATLQIERVGAAVRQRFADWYHDLIDLPGVFYQQTVDWVFRENRFARGSFPALGRSVGLGEIGCPLFLLAATGDDVVNPKQLLAIASRVGTRKNEIITRLVEGRHLSLFMGKRILGEVWPDIARFLKGRPAQMASAAPSSGRAPGRRRNDKAKPT
ncbi:MAG: hypothetical protein FD175_2935 [Beijerinckiaceae bacterium]|nr:MAG: hypothetical protein FD175_2935 [Beijerinckiaceae bacterium]